jgi:hypothetical protein
MADRLVEYRTTTNDVCEDLQPPEGEGWDFVSASAVSTNERCEAGPDVAYFVPVIAVVAVWRRYLKPAIKPAPPSPDMVS